MIIFLVPTETVVPRLNTFLRISDGRCLLFVEVKTRNSVLQSSYRLDKQWVPMSLDKWSLKTSEGEQNRLRVLLHQFTLVDQKLKSPMLSLLKKLTAQQGKQSKTGDRKLRNFSVSSAELCLQHFLRLLLVYPCLRHKWSSTFVCEEHRECYWGDGMAEKKQARGLPPPPALFHQISPSYLHPHIPNSPSSFTACSLFCILVETTHV